MKNSANSRHKFSKLEIATNIYIIVIVLLQMIVSLVGAIYTTVWSVKNENTHFYLQITDDTNNIALLFITTFGTWFLSMMNMVPISLIVTLEMVKFI